MSNQEILLWSQRVHLDDDEGNQASAFEWGSLFDNWDGFMTFAQREILSGSTKKRTGFINGRLIPLATRADLSMSQTMDLFKLVIITLPRYVDNLSRDAVLNLAKSLIRRDELRGKPEGEPEATKMGVTEQIIGWLKVEADRVSKMAGAVSAAQISVLFAWVCNLYTLILSLDGNFTKTNSWSKLVSAFAILFDLLLDSTTPIKLSLQKSAIVQARRAIRLAPSVMVPMIKSLNDWILTPTHNIKWLPLVGLIYEVAFHLREEATKQAILPEIKGYVLRLYISCILQSKVTTPLHTLTAFDPFIRDAVLDDDHTREILPVVERMLLRSPEISLPSITRFYLFYSHSITTEQFHSLLTPVLSCSKSANPIVRQGAVNLFKAIIPHSPETSDSKQTVNLILAPCLGGKSNGPDHRQALYLMLSYIKPDMSVSRDVVEILLPFMEKETSEMVLATLTEVVPKHLAFLLKDENAPTLNPVLVASILKDMSSTKPASRRTVIATVGQVFWEISQEVAIWPAAASGFFQDLRPALEKVSSEAATASTATTIGGAVDAWAALTVLLYGCYKSTFASTIKKHPAIQSIVVTSGKPSFLYSDKIYQKITEPKEAIWLLRALESAMTAYSDAFSNNSRNSQYFGQAIVWLAVDHTSPEVRREALACTKRLSTTFPIETNVSIRTALHALLFEEKRSTATVSDSEFSRHKAARMATLLSSSSNLESQPDSSKENLVVEMLLVSHHKDFGFMAQNQWIELVQQVKLDPYHVVVRKLDEITSLIEATINQAESGSIIRNAALKAVTTLVFVAPKEALPNFLGLIEDRLEPNQLKSLGTYELGVWNTSPGTLFVDVLASKKNSGTVIEKGKEADIKKWEAELRKTLAQKNSAQPTLTKQEKALFDSQLAKEEATRGQLQLLQKRLQDGLSLCQSLLTSRSLSSSGRLPWLASLLSEGVVKLGTPFVGSSGILTYFDVFLEASERLESHRLWIAVATLRSHDIQDIPENYTVEALDSLLGRLLYRIKSLSEQIPFEADTFSLFWPLLSQIIHKGGINAASEDDAIEQLVLVLEIVRSHSVQFADVGYPRQSICQALVTLISQHPKVSRDAIAVLLEVGDTIHSSASESEQDLLISSTLSQEVFVRNACLQAMQSFDLTEREWLPALWTACHDADDQNANLARVIWVENGLDVPETFMVDLIPYLSHSNSYVRQSSARSLKESLEIWPSSKGSSIATLQTFYREKAKPLVPEYDEFGMVIASTLDRVDPWEARLATADAFYQIAALFSEDQVIPFFQFLIEAEAIGDRNLDVRRRMLEAGVLIIQIHGKNALQGLIKTFEDFLAANQSGTDTEDHIRQAVVILLGAIAQHLQKSDRRVKDVISRLIEALKTPSEVVQESVADCLTPLAPLVESDIATIIDLLYKDLTTGPKYAVRRGAAYGIAGIIRGTGVIGIQKYNIIRRIRDAAGDKTRYETRQGASFVLETLARILGRRFEPYIVQLLPVLLASFGDANAEVREATIDASKVIMGTLSGYGVKQIMPKVMEGLEERQWRTKKGSVELLGSMAFCAPKQLSSALPTVIPQLTVVLTDSHAQVRAAGNKSLKQFGEVITNPEIHSLVSTLLKALVDPEKTAVALNALLKKSFVHYIDSPSLAIVIPIIERGLRERSADTKRKATQIVGQMAGLTDSKDFIPYLTRLLPLVHIVLVDPVPEARATAAKALGTLVERLGEGQFPDLVQDLLKTLRSDTSGVDRQGAAQGLSEVISGLGMERLEGLLPDIISSASSPRSYVREGFMSLLVYLPATFGARFQPHLSKVIPPILRGLADTEEYVREASMKAGRMIVVNYSNKAVDLLLPELEQGIFDSGWRIRQSSITLIGELLFRLSGISGKSELDEEEEVDAVAAESSRKMLIDVLGKERNDRVLAALYLVRQDAVAAVRMASIHIWKALVSNTPRTVREILPTLINLAIDLLSMPSGDQKDTAARTLGELCRKFGERILGDILPILERGSRSSNERIREGVCLAMSELIENSSEAQRDEHESQIVDLVRRSLVDSSARCRAAAAIAFDVLQEVMGARAIDETIPTLLEALRQPGESSGTALQALREVMTVRATTVFPVLIPTLIATPMTAFNARALASLVTVAGAALSKRLTIILTALIRAVENQADEALKADINEAISALLGSISDQEGLQTLMLLLAGWVKNESWARRVSAINFFETFCKVSTLDFALYRLDWVRNLVALMDDRKAEVVEAAVPAFEAFIKSTDKEELDSMVVTLRRTIEGTGAPGRGVPGFSLKGSISSMMPIIIAGLTTGSNEQREQAAYAIGDLVERTEEVAFKPYVVQFTGPLIRVATQATAYPPGVKVAILKSLTAMLERIPMQLKPFFPQLSRTFVKSCGDNSSLAVRNAAAKALGTLTQNNQTRVDALLTELLSTSKSSDDEAVAASLVLATAHVVRSAINSISPESKDTCVSLIESTFKEKHDDSYLHAVASLFTSLETNPELLKPIVQANLLQGTPPSVLSSLMILHVVEDAPKLFYTLECVPSILKKVVESIGEPVPGISRPAREAKELTRTTPPFCDDEAVHTIFGA